LPLPLRLPCLPLNPTSGSIVVRATGADHCFISTSKRLHCKSQLGISAISSSSTLFLGLAHRRCHNSQRSTASTGGNSLPLHVAARGARFLSPLAFHSVRHPTVSWREISINENKDLAVESWPNPKGRCLVSISLHGSFAMGMVVGAQAIAFAQ